MNPTPPALPWWARLYLWATERLYHEFAWAYDAVSWLVSLGRWHRWRSLALDHVWGERVLELGCGTGALLTETARRGWRTVGVEPSPEMRRVAHRRLRRAGSAASLLAADARALPFATGAFDTVVATFPSDYIARPEVLAEAARVLAPPAAGSGPRLVIAGLLVETDNRWLALLPWFAPAGSTVRAQEFLRERARDAGLVLTVQPHRDGPVQVPVLVLEKQHAE